MTNMENASMPPLRAIPAGGTNARPFAVGGLLLGAAISMALNLASNWKPAPNTKPVVWMQPGTSVPELVFLSVSVVLPLAMVLAVEVLVRQDWPEGRPWLIPHFGVIAAGALMAVMSFSEVHALLLALGHDEWVAIPGGLFPDILMTVSSVALLSHSVRERAAERAAQAAPVLEDQAPVEQAPLVAVGADTPAEPEPERTPSDEEISAEVDRLEEMLRQAVERVHPPIAPEPRRWQLPRLRLPQWLRREEDSAVAVDERAKQESVEQDQADVDEQAPAGDVVALPSQAEIRALMQTRERVVKTAEVVEHFQLGVLAKQDRVRLRNRVRHARESFEGSSAPAGDDVAVSGDEQ